MSAVKASLVSTLRSRLGDDRASVPAFSVGVSGAESALLEISGGVLSVQVMRGTAQSIRFPLSSPDYSTVSRLCRSIANVPGYTAVADVDVRGDHNSFDLCVDGGIVDVAKSAYVLKHRRFSDNDLDSLVTEAATVHNPNFSNGRIPPTEHPWVLMKAQSRAYRMLAAEAAKNSGQAENAESFLSLARDLDRQYSEERNRHARTIARPKMDESRIGSGDVVVGTLTRNDPRTGLMAPIRGAQNADPPVLLEPYTSDCSVTLRWRQNREDWFGKIELWRDIFPEVERSKAGASQDASGAQEDDGSLGTSVRVWSSGTTSALEDNQAVDRGETHPLEPDSVYYYRLYAFTRNGDFLPSNVVRATTREPRARFARESNGALGAWSDVISGPSGTAFSLTGTAFHEGMSLLVGGKPVTDLSVVSATVATGTIPTFLNPAVVGTRLDVALVSLSGLTDVLKASWSYTA